MERRMIREWAGSACLLFVFLTGCSTTPVVDQNAPPPFLDSEDLLDKDARYPLQVYDPWEGFNRRVYQLNAVFDEIVFLPVVNGYRAVTPEFVRTGISNFFSNLREIRNVLNAVLQLKLDKAVHTTSRFVWNSTLGLGGFIDVATHMDLPQQNEDFGQTLGVWGVDQGPYLVLPIFGPSSVRDGLGFGVDWFADLTIRNAFLDLKTWQELTLTGLKAIDTRHRIAFRYFGTGSPFEYDLIRMLYTKKRQFQVKH